jgi:transposase InsO family protein
MTKPKRTQDEVATERFEMIAPLIGGGLDKGLRHELVRKAAEKGCVSERTIRRLYAAWESGGFDALKPSRGYSRPDAKLPEQFDDIVETAIELRREVPSRSVNDIIKILELEGAIGKGSVSRSTLQRRLQERGFGASQIKVYTQKGAAARRFKKEHRCELWMGDIKYGPYIKDKNGKNRQIYLVVWLDDATRFIVGARFYYDQKVGVIEDSFRTAIQKYGIPDKIFVDNGKQYRSIWLSGACAKIGVKLLTARPYRPEAKGAIERFNRTVDKFISEAAVEKPSSLNEYNELLDVWLDEYYHKNGHAGLGGISPSIAFGTDSRALSFVSEEKLREAFLHTETRKVDKTGCVSFLGDLYEVGLAYIAQKIEIKFDASWDGEILACPAGAAPFTAKKLVISSNCGVGAELPEWMKTKPADTSRMLTALKKEHGKREGVGGVATSFKEYREDENV